VRRTFDVVIIGGGIMGCAVALELSRRSRRVLLVEKNAICSGATGRSSAIVRQHYSHENTARMALHGLHVFQEFDERVGGECGFLQRGFVVLVPEKDRRGLEANVALQRGVGIRTELVAPEALCELIPGVDTAELVAAAWEPESGYADPHLTTHGYAQAAKRHGATLLQGVEVTGLELTGDRVTGVRTGDGAFLAPAVVNCAGPWGARVAAMAGLEAPIRSSRIQVAVFERPPAYRDGHPVVLDFVHASYFRPETGDLMLVGRIDPEEADDVVDADACPDHADDAFIADVGERWIRRCPPMEESRARNGYSGLYAVTPDWHPIVDETPAGSGFFQCTGFSGHGFKLAPAVGVMTADMVTAKPDPEFDWRPFSLSRFAESRQIRGTYEYSITG